MASSTCALIFFSGWIHLLYKSLSCRILLDFHWGRCQSPGTTVNGPLHWCHTWQKWPLLLSCNLPLLPWPHRLLKPFLTGMESASLPIQPQVLLGAAQCHHLLSVLVPQLSPTPCQLDLSEQWAGPPIPLPIEYSKVVRPAKVGPLFSVAAPNHLLCYLFGPVSGTTFSHLSLRSCWMFRHCCSKPVKQLKYVVPL